MREIIRGNNYVHKTFSNHCEARSNLHMSHYSATCARRTLLNLLRRLLRASQWSLNLCNEKGKKRKKAPHPGRATGLRKEIWKPLTIMHLLQENLCFRKSRA